MTTVKHILTDGEVWAIANALRTAAEQYDAIADELCDKRAIQGFRDQKTVALALAERLEGAASLTIEEDHRPMTFEQFQATRQENTDIGIFLHDEILQGQKGFLYLDALYIEHVDESWPEEASAKGKYHLLIERDEWISNNLEELERRLYEFAQSAGYFDYPSLRNRGGVSIMRRPAP